MNYLVSIITPCYNSIEFIEQTIDSVLEQSYLNWEMIIVDDSSTDKSQDIILKKSKEDKRIKPIFLKQNVGGVYSGFISGVKEWGFYVELIENSCEGLVKVSSIKDDHYYYDEKSFSLVGYRTKKSFQLGQKVKIKIKNVDLEKKQLDFILV